MSFPVYKFENLLLTGVIETYRANSDFLTLLAGDNPETETERLAYISDMLADIEGVTLAGVIEDIPEAVDDPRILRIRRALDARFRVDAPALVVASGGLFEFGEANTRNQECTVAMESVLNVEDDMPGTAIEILAAGIRDVYYADGFLASVNTLSHGGLSAAYKFQQDDPSNIGLSADGFLRTADFTFRIRGTISETE